MKSATSEAELQKFKSLMSLFEKYGKQYNMDYLLMMAQGYQESQLDQNAKSQVGAVGVMQVMPATGKELKVGDVRQIEPNIHAGVKYIRFMIDQYFKDEPMTPLNNGLFAFAAYNCRPGPPARSCARKRPRQGLDPNIWFNNVERIAARADRPRDRAVREQHLQVLRGVHADCRRLEEDRWPAAPVGSEAALDSRRATSGSGPDL